MTVSHHLVPQEDANFQRLVDYTDLAGLPEIWTRAVKEFGNLTALCDRHSKPEIELTFQELATLLQQFAAGLQSLIPDEAWQPTTEAGLTIPPRAALIADNCARWFVADQGMMTAGLAASGALEPNCACLGRAVGGHNRGQWAGQLYLTRLVWRS